MTNSDIQEPLRPLSDLPVMREANASFGLTVENHHQLLSEINIRSEAPLGVKQLFETAKNLSLYSWFVYHFHQVSEMVSFSAMEMAMRERYLEENPPEELENDSKKKPRPPTLGKLLNYAKTNQWISNENLSFSRDWAYRNAQDKKVREIMESGVLEKIGSCNVPEPTEVEIQNELSELDIVGTIASFTPQVRNILAHGSTMLSPSSISTLKRIAEVINQLY